MFYVCVYVCVYRSNCRVLVVPKSQVVAPTLGRGTRGVHGRQRPRRVPGAARATSIDGSALLTQVERGDTAFRRQA